MNRGIPYASVAITGVVSLLTYLSCGSGAAIVFNWLGNLATTCALMTWITVCIVYLRFYAALKAQGIDRNALHFKSPFQPYLTWVCLVFFVVVTFFNGFYSWSPWSYETFVTSYLAVMYVAKYF